MSNWWSIKTFIFAVSLPLVVSVSNAAQVDEWWQQLEHPRYAEETLQPENMLSHYVQHDFSSLLIPRTSFLGYIGDGYKRLWIEFNNVHRDLANPGVHWSPACLW